MIKLSSIASTTIPIEADCLTPDRLAGKSVAEIARLPVQYGNARLPLAEFFRIEGDAADQRLVLEGDCSRVKWVGAGMRSGKLTIDGPIGMHAGAEMRGGSIEVQGCAGDWLGAEMRGGLIRVHKDAGHLVGGCYRGGRAGMRGGAILVEGSAGNEIGNAMRRGFIAVGGNAGDFTGVSMIAGSVLVFGKPGMRAGAGMKRGTIALFGDTPEVLPSFRFSCLYEPLFLDIYIRFLRAAGFSVREELIHGMYRRFAGDLVALGKGEILVFAG
ncbi:MAG TPA: formylmethanofuran dehydrogenase subunit C [Planctomycetaceae bacterium]|nr:formylmethanofuran dehydrogenase subunit C [Planctomycetaceae bacterium]